MSKNILRIKTKRFALDVIRFVTELPKRDVCRVIGKQLLRSGTSVGANYRASIRARSSAEFVSKLGIVEEEVDESKYWLELLEESDTIGIEKINKLYSDANEIEAMTVASIKTARKKKRKY